MSHQTIDDLWDEVHDILPKMTPHQVGEITRLLNDNDLEEARWYLSFLAKNYRADDAQDHFHKYDLLVE